MLIADLKIGLVQNEQFDNPDVPLCHGEEQRDIAELVCLVDIRASIDVEFYAEYLVVPREDMNAFLGCLYTAPRPRAAGR